MLLDVFVLNPAKVVFEGKAKNVILPGEDGIFEVTPFHKRFLSRLISGTLFVDEKSFDIQKGIVSVDQNKVTVIIE